MSEYYIPDITEFHVGFKCEMKNSSDPIYFDWEHCTFKDDFSNELSEDYCFEYLRTDLKEENIRVKYLDREDIESFGFEYYMENKNQKLHIFYKDNVLLAYDEANNKIKTFTKDPSLNKEYMMTNVDPYLINNIIIKNKSEFKKFLKQINLL